MNRVLLVFATFVGLMISGTVYGDFAEKKAKKPTVEKKVPAPVVVKQTCSSVTVCRMPLVTTKPAEKIIKVVVNAPVFVVNKCLDRCQCVVKACAPVKVVKPCAPAKEVKACAAVKSAKKCVKVKKVRCVLPWRKCCG
jgi:hypothetical protein